MRRRFRTVRVAVAATVALAVMAALAPGLARGAAEGKFGLAYTYGEVVVDEEGGYTLSPTSALGLRWAGRAGERGRGLPDFAWEGYAATGGSPLGKAGATVEAEWEPEAGLLVGRRYSLATSLAGRWPEAGGASPETSWEVDLAAHESGLGLSALEAGGRTGAHLHRLSGRDYWEAGGYLGTRFVLEGEPNAAAWLDPGWFRGFASLFAPPPEPGVEAPSDLPAWYEAISWPGLPPLPPADLPEAEAAGAPPKRLVVTTRHTQTARAYAGAATSDWQAGETRLEVRERRPRGEVGASYTHLLKSYPADSPHGYQLDEGELEVSGPAGAGRGRAQVNFRNRSPWEGGTGGYRQLGLGLGFTRPGASAGWRFGGEWRWRRHESSPEDDYLFTGVESEVSWPADSGGAPGPRASLALAGSGQRYPSGAEPTLYRLRLRLRDEAPAGPGRTVSAGLAWERSLSVAPGGAATLNPPETLLRLSWTQAF